MAGHKLFKAKACPNPECRKPYMAGQVLHGWRPCRCAGAVGGGHVTAECRADAGGCGHVFAEGHVGPDEPPERMPNFGQARE
jgi:hypothetical protein